MVKRDELKGVILLKKSAAIIGGAAAFLAVTAGAYMPFVISDARKEFNDKCEYLLILGGNIIGEETPSPQLLDRMRAAAEYLVENTDVIAVACGGCFRKEQKKSEAEIIANYLIEKGVAESRILLEDKSTTTFENFEFGTQIIKNHSQKELADIKIAFLSSSYHVHRASAIAKLSGIKNCGRVSCKTQGSAVKRFAREYFVAYELAYKWLKK